MHPVDDPPTDARSATLRPGDPLRRVMVVVATTLFVVLLGWWGARLRADGVPVHLGVPPLYAKWRESAEGLWPAAIAAAALIIAMVLIWWVRASERIGWVWLLVGSWAWSLAWSVTLAVTDGRPRLSEPLLDARFEYLPLARSIRDPTAFVSGFLSHLSDMPTHVRGHPPGAVLAFWGIDRVFGSDRSFTLALLVLATSAAPASLIALRAVSDSATARRAAPFVGLAPAVIWIATAPDSLFAAVTTWAVALAALAYAASDRRISVTASAGAGLLAGVALCLSYGAAALVAPLAVLWVLMWWHRHWIRATVIAIGALLAPATLAIMGFDWWAGLSAVREQYLAGVGGERPAGYFLLANLAVMAVIVGPAGIAGLATLRDRRVWLLVGGALIGVVASDLSGMSRGEVERIWLPLLPWVVLATTSIGSRRERTAWAAVTMLMTLALQLLLVTPW